MSVHDERRQPRARLALGLSINAPDGEGDISVERLVEEFAIVRDGGLEEAIAVIRGTHASMGHEPDCVCSAATAMKMAEAGVRDLLYDEASVDE